MNGRARVYGALAVIGFATPVVFVGLFVGDNGWDVGLLLDEITDSWSTCLVLADLAISATVFLVWSAGEASRAGIKWWPYLLATLLVGMCFAFPLFLFNRERRAAAAA